MAISCQPARKANIRGPQSRAGLKQAWVSGAIDGGESYLAALRLCLTALGTRARRAVELRRLRRGDDVVGLTPDRRPVDPGRRLVARIQPVHEGAAGDQLGTSAGAVGAEDQRGRAVVGGRQRDDPARDGLLGTPDRVVRSYEEFFSGYFDNPADILKRTFEEVEGYDEVVLVSDIDVHSHCEHHLVPFVGKAHVAYIPKGRVVGLSKLARVVEGYSKRLQVQEKLTAQIADCIAETLQPQGVAVIIQCQHFCMCHRGVHKPNSWTTTSKLTGAFLDNPSSRLELFQLIGMRKGLD